MSDGVVADAPLICEDTQMTFRSSTRMTFAAASWTSLFACGGETATIIGSTDAGSTQVSGESAPVADTLHHAGEVCTTCHADFTLSGTLFWERPGVEDLARREFGHTPVRHGCVRFLDATRSYRAVATDCNGNFVVKRTEWRPSFPVRVDVTSEDKSASAHVRRMQAPIAGAGSCADCHAGPVFMMNASGEGGAQVLDAPCDPEAPLPICE
jgi:hypothetical protein